MTTFQNEYRVESHRLKDWDYSSRGWYFVTLCTKDKKCSLGQANHGEITFSEAGIIADAELRAVPAHYSNVTIDRFVVMPQSRPRHCRNRSRPPILPRRDGACTVSDCPSPGCPRARLSNIVGGYKSAVSRICHTKGIAHFAWQSRFHDHVLRSNASLNAVRDYIDKNPGNWLLDPDNQDGAAA